MDQKIEKETHVYNCKICTLSLFNLILFAVYVEHEGMQHVLIGFFIQKIGTLSLSLVAVIFALLLYLVLQRYKEYSILVFNSNQTHNVLEIGYSCNLEQHSKSTCILYYINQTCIQIQPITRGGKMRLVPVWMTCMVNQNIGFRFFIIRWDQCIFINRWNSDHSVFHRTSIRGGNRNKKARIVTPLVVRVKVKSLTIYIKPLRMSNPWVSGGAWAWQHGVVISL